ncbi:MAG: hypothetical protein ACI4Q3_00475 [Kiritimatiellia bacterium]
MTNAEKFSTPAVKIAHFADYIATSDGFKAIKIARDNLGMSEIAATNLVFSAWLTTEAAPEDATETENPEWETTK